MRACRAVNVPALARVPEDHPKTILRALDVGCVGVMVPQIESPQQAIPHTQPHFTAFRITGQDCWARDVVCDETMTSVSVHGRRITLQQVFVQRKARAHGASWP